MAANAAACSGGSGRFGRLLVGFGGVRLVDGERSRDTVLGRELQELGEDLANLLLGNSAREQRHGLPGTSATTIGMDWARKACASCGFASTSTFASRTRPAELGDHGLEDRAQLLARAAPLGPQVDHDRDRARELQDLAEGLVGRIPHKARTGRGRAPAGAGAVPGAGGCGRLRSDDRSTAPRRMAPGLAF